MIQKRLRLMQLSLVDEVPELNKIFFLDIYAESYFDSSRKRMRLSTMNGQRLPAEMGVSCHHKMIEKYPEGTIFKLDARLVRREGKKPYFIAIHQSNVQRAVEYFDYNLKVQNGFDYTASSKSKSKK